MGGDGGAGVDVSVLIPTLNEETHLPALLERLRGQEFPGRIEFLFIDGRSDDGTRRLVEGAAAADPRFRLLDNPGRGIPFALNIGLRHSRGEFVARMDAHTLYPRHYLALGVERLRRGGAQWVSGPQIAYGVDLWSRIAAAALSTPLGIGGATFRTAPDSEIETDTGYTGVWRREALEGLGGWDEGWAVNEDGELAARLRAEGGRIVCLPEMSARYIPRNSLQALARQYWRYGQYRAKTSGAHPESMRPSHVLPPALVLASASAALGPRRRPNLGRLAVAAYVAALVATGAGFLRSGLEIALGVPAALVTMHFAWGAGFLVGCARFGSPVRALAGLISPFNRGSGG